MNTLDTEQTSKGETIADVDRRHKNSLLLEEYSKRKELQKRFE